MSRNTAINLVVFVPFDGTPDEHEGVLVLQLTEFGLVPPSNMKLQNEDDGPCIELDPEKPFTFRRVSDGRGDWVHFVIVYAKIPNVSRSEIVTSFSRRNLWYIYKTLPSFDDRDPPSRFDQD